jgi:hypothetical protein
MSLSPWNTVSETSRKKQGLKQVVQVCVDSQSAESLVMESWVSASGQTASYWFFPPTFYEYVIFPPVQL